MAQNYPFAREDVFPSWFADRIQDFLSAARTDLRLSRKSGTTVEVVPNTELGISAIAIEGRWRFNEGSVQRDHPGGAKGTYAVWAVATDNDVDDTPKPHTDHTDYSFDLRITSGANPSGSGVEIFEKIGEIDWSGTEIETIRQTHGSVTGQMLEDGALSSEAPSDITWTRAPDGGLVAGLKANSVGATELADNSVDTAALVALAVTITKIAEEAVATGKIANLAVIEAKIAEEAVGTAKVKNLAIIATKIAEEAIITGKIANLAVTTAKIANEAIVLAKLAASVQQALVPSGAIFSYLGEEAPAGYLLLIGQNISRTTYAGIYAVLGTKWGVGDGATTFGLPDGRGSVLVGADGGAGRVSANNALGNRGGEEKHTMLEAEMPSHAHAAGSLQTAVHVYKPDPSQIFGNEGNATFGFNGAVAVKSWNDVGNLAIAGAMGASGGGGAHNNLQPYLVVNHIVKI